MFVCSVKANTLKFIGIIGLALVSLVAMIMLLPEYTPKTTAAIANSTAEYKYDKIKTNDDRLGFLSQFGWQADSQVTEGVTMRIPSDFDKVMNSYNELQKKMGLDLTKYKGKEVTRYTYNISNYPGYDGKVIANIIIYKNRVIGGDISSADVSGFISTFEMPENHSADSSTE